MDFFTQNVSVAFWSHFIFNIRYNEYLYKIS